MMKRNKSKNHPLARYQDDITDITSRFNFTHHPVSDASGLIISPQGFAQPFFHKPTNTVGVLFSKIADNLRGQTLPNGKRVGLKEEMDACYIFGARRLKGSPGDSLHSRPNLDKTQHDLRDDLDKARRLLGLRSRKHFTLYNADNIYTNGRHVYEITARKDGRFSVVFHMATRRADGGFMPFDLNDKSLRGRFSHANKIVEITNTYPQAQRAVARHWKKFSADLWEERNIFLSQGVDMLAKKLLSDFVYTAIEDAPVVIASTTLVGGILGLSYGASLGIVGGAAVGFSAAASHTAIHLPIETGLKEYREIVKKSADARKKINIEAYDYSSDASDHFKIQTAENIAKVCPHIDLDRFSAADFELLSADQFSIKKDQELVHENVDASSLAGHLLFMGQQGFSSIAKLLDRRTELREFQNGVSRLMHEREDGKIIAFAKYYPEKCDKERALHSHHVEQFNDDIVRLEYDRSKPTLTQGLPKSDERISYNEMMQEVEKDMLFRNCIASRFVKQKSMASLMAAFTNLGNPNFESKNMTHSPSMAALNLPW